MSKTHIIKDWVTSGGCLNSDVSNVPSNWKCPSLVKETLHGNISPNSLLKGTRPGSPLFGQLWMYMTPELLDGLSPDLKLISLEIHFSLSCNKEGKLPFYPVDKNIPLFGTRGAFFYVDEDSESSHGFIAGPTSNIGYFGATIPSAQVFMPILGLHLNISDSSIPYHAAPRTVPKWKLSVSISKENLSFLGKSFNVLSSGRMLPSQVLYRKFNFLGNSGRETVIFFLRRKQFYYTMGNRYRNRVFLLLGSSYNTRIYLFWSSCICICTHFHLYF